MIKVEMNFNSLADLRDQLFGSAVPVPPSEADSTPEPKKRRGRPAKKKEEPAKAPEGEVVEETAGEITAEQTATCRKALVAAADRTDMPTVLGMLKEVAGDGVTRADEVTLDTLQAVLDAAEKLGA